MHILCSVPYHYAHIHTMIPLKKKMRGKKKVKNATAKGKLFMFKLLEKLVKGNSCM